MEQKIKLYLFLKELEDHIDHGIFRTKTETEAARWRGKSKARTIIGLHLSDDYLEMVRECDTAIEMEKQFLTYLIASPFESPSRTS